MARSNRRRKGSNEKDREEHDIFNRYTLPRRHINGDWKLFEVPDVALWMRGEDEMRNPIKKIITVVELGKNRKYAFIVKGATEEEINRYRLIIDNFIKSDRPILLTNNVEIRKL